ncbi:dTDP-4-dehydrorhamnose reductase [Cellulosilyticum sp. I15G10I2]|uniref:dTDP-4-dehydrorhamnose reductase n=1 Tax=Cellulosilyticum sp. I15G10I2 TaxID=1892843 RepID=UPI00085C1F46|nr:dTDP-4-dehydrorhamnose reductase [Cellulosilyticum sp. I15G10I2]
MKVLITGGKGQLGIELLRQLYEKEGAYKIMSTNHDTLDITDLEKVKQVLLSKQPDIVINCAAHTAVDRCEQDIEDAYRVNALGAKHLAIACEVIGAKLVHISTDYVFEGNNPEPRREDDKAAPQSIYGSSKLLGEEYVKTFCKKHFILRIDWLYGEGNNFVKTMLKLAETHKELNVVDDQIGSPTSTKDLAGVIIALMQTAYYGTYHATCEGQCSWHDFACMIFALKHIDIKVNPITSKEFVSLAKRPRFSVLDNFMLKLYGLNHFRHWEEALRDYLENEEASSGEI